METVTTHVAKSTLSQLLARVEAGEEIIIARGSRAIAKLVPIQPSASKRQFGALRNIVTVTADFFAPLPTDELVGWDQ